MASILSVGIDIGTSTTQLVFSRIDLGNTAGYFTAPRIAITGKELLYRSPVHFTPLKSEVLIDAEGVRQIVAEEFRKAGYTPADTQTGAVIITGESARKENAAAVLSALSDFAGEFVVSTAGPDLESVIAGKGSGAWQYSVDMDCTAANLDIGGGTTNIVFFSGGAVQGKLCLDIGGRLIRLDTSSGGDPAITYISPAAAAAARLCGVTLEKGMRVAAKDLRKVTDIMADCLAGAVGLGPVSPLQALVKTPQSSEYVPAKAPQRICFSGGVADCIQRAGEAQSLSHPQEDFPYGDIGVLLGRSIAENEAFRNAKTIRGGETIRATVVGAGTYTTNLSGSTIYYSDGIFPVKNVPALKISESEQWRMLGGETELLREKAAWFLSQRDENRLLLALPGMADPDFSSLKALAKCIAEGLDGLLGPGEPLITLVEKDMAKALGIALQGTGCGRKMAAIDSVRVEEGDFVDIGRPLMDGLVVPVVVKTLLFG